MAGSPAPETAIPAKPRTRPRDRREQILAAATDLFHRRGFANVAMNDIAEEALVRPSAIYRHFPSKNALLVTATARQFQAFHDIVNGSDQSLSGDLIARLAAASLDNRQLGVLWQRECRHLDAEQRSVLRAQLLGIVEPFVRALHAHRPDLRKAHADLLGWSTFAILHSSSYHYIELPRARYEALIAELIQIVTELVVTDNENHPRTVPVRPQVSMRSRREALLVSATRLFAQNGYAAVSIDDIGDSVGIAGPSVYNHFQGKADILVAAMTRGTETLRIEMSRAYSGARNHDDALERLAASYVEFALGNSELIDVLIGELAHVPPAQQQQTRQAQREYITEWVHLLTETAHGTDQLAARIRVQAALTVVNDIARTPHLSTLPGLANTLADIVLAVLRPYPVGNAPQR
jgi:AcrR family transcriptional regulator